MDCAVLSLTLLIGLVVNATMSWWWLDAVTALLLVPWLLREGLDGVRRKRRPDELRLRFCQSCLFGLKPCRAACCTA